jgi:hypothetical protein
MRLTAVSCRDVGLSSLKQKVKIVVLILKLIDEKIVEMDKDSFVVRMWAERMNLVSTYKYQAVFRVINFHSQHNEFLIL